MTMAGPCEPGDVLGVVAGDFAVVGSDLDTVAADVLERLLGGGGELVTHRGRRRRRRAGPADRRGGRASGTRMST